MRYWECYVVMTIVVGVGGEELRRGTAEGGQIRTISSQISRKGK